MIVKRSLSVACTFLSAVLCFAGSVMGQTETGTVSGLVTDSSGGVVAGAEVQLQSVDRGTTKTATTNDAGIYVFASVHPGQYQLTVRKPGFKQVDLLGLIVNVQDHIEQNFRLQVGSVTESVTVTGGAESMNTTDASVSTVVDRQFAENLPLNGRSFQTLIQLIPGVVLTPTNGFDAGQFSVNGQRASANYFMVDGVSANIAASATTVSSQTAGGVVAGFSALGGTNNLVSVDALQEFRVQTSSYSPEFGRTPGAQVSIETRSGTNAFHGTLFEYLRNDVFDANDWFANQKGLAKAKERQNDFGGVVGGPILKNNTFFFFSYEGLRLRLPQTDIKTVPSLASRQSAPAAIQPFLNAFPRPSGPDVAGGLAQFNATHSDHSTLNAASLRIDHRLGTRLTVFGRYNYAPSDLRSRGFGGITMPNDITDVSIKTETLTLGATWSRAPATNNDFRFNYSRVRAASNDTLDTFGGAAVPPDAFLLPTPFSTTNARSGFNLLSVQGGFFGAGKIASNLQRQINLVDGLSMQRALHSLKFGADYRRLSPRVSPRSYEIDTIFSSVASALALQPAFAQITSATSGTLLLHNLGAFVQDTWRVRRRFTLTYGGRWDLDVAPSTAAPPNFLAVVNFGNLSTLAIAPPGAPIFQTKYGNVAPRIGVAYQLSPAQGHETILRGGFGIFYDLATQQLGDALGTAIYPFSLLKTVTAGLTFPLPPSVAQPPPISLASAVQPGGRIFAFDPDLKLPYTLQWNAAVEQALGGNQAFSVSYIGAAGRRLIQQQQATAPNPGIAGLAQLVGNSATSDYHALQAQFRRRMSLGLQATASYTWSHSIDSASSATVFSRGDQLAKGLSANANRGSSDFDVRHSFSVGVTYGVLTFKEHRVLRGVLGDWSLDNMIQGRTAIPVDVFLNNLSQPGSQAAVRPDLVPGIPLYLNGSQYPGGKILNGTPNQGGTGCKGPFCPPPTDPVTRLAVRQGNLGRNALRGFGAFQWDFAARREFALWERFRMQFRAEVFNLVNHPNFANLDRNVNSASFGQSTMMLNRGLGGSQPGTGGFSPLYQVGGPRSVQVALKLMF